MTPRKPHSTSAKQAREAASTLKWTADPVKLQIVLALWERGEIQVGKLCNA